MINEIKQEASLPVQSRVDVMVLASINKYLESEGTYVTSMSQLVSWALDLLCNILSNNNLLKMNYLSFTEAYDYLKERGLYQPGVGKGGHKKAIKARRFESMRSRGIDPKVVDKDHYHDIHNKRSIMTAKPSGQISTQQGETLIEEATRIYEEMSKPKVMFEKGDKPRDTSPIVEQVSTGGLNEEKYKLLMGEPSVDSKGKVGSRPKLKSKEEADKAMLEVEKEDRIELDRLKNM